MNTVKLEKTIRTLMRKRKTPGMAIAVCKDNETLYAKGFGARNLKQHQAMDADTLIGIGSITKSFTAFAIMKLQEMGRLSIEDSAAQYLNAEPFASRPEICIKHMLAHSTGIPSMDAGMLAFTYQFDDFSRIYPASNRADFLAHMADAEEFIFFKPGERFFYNNDMYTCLGFIVEAVTDISFEQFVQEQILEPLEMTRAVFTQQGLDSDGDNHNHNNNNTMTGYRFDTKDGRVVLKESAVPIDGYLQAPGGIYTSMNEMLNYAQCLLNKGTFKGRRVLSPESVATLFKGQIITPYGEGQNPEYSLGWTVENPTEQVPHVVIQHGGGMETSQSFLALVPDLNLGIAVAENASTAIAPLVTRMVIAEQLGQDHQQAIEDLRIVEALKAIEGTYQSPYEMYSLKVSRKGVVLQADLETDDGSFSFPLIPKDLDKLEFTTYSLRSDNKARVFFYRNSETQQVEFASYDRFMYKRD